MTTASEGEVLPPPERLTGRDHLSFSSIRLFASCPLNYFFRKIKGLPEETVAASLVFGTSFHAAVECHFQELLAGNPPPSLDALLAVFWGAWHARESQAIHFARGEDASTMGHLAERMFRAFQSSAFAHPAGTIIAVEEVRCGG